VDAVVALLEAEHEDVGILAKEVLSLAWDKLIDREWWCVILNQPGVAVTAHGPFESKTVLERYLKKYPAAVKEPRGYMFRMMGVTSVEGVEDD
jgi:hypothetical protein